MIYSNNKIQLKDIHYLVLWDAKDIPKIQKWQERIRAGIDKSEDFFLNLDKKWNDHKVYPEPLEIGIDDKYMLTWAGIAKFCRLITLQDTTTFTHVAVGTGSTIPQPYDQSLVSEKTYIDFATNGFFDGSGTSLRYAGTFDAAVETAQLKESLVRNQASPSGATVMCRNIFPINYINHTGGGSGFTAGGIIEFVPVVD